MAERPVFGIDLGTTYSCIAHLDKFEQPTVIPNQQNALTTPSVVYIESPGAAVVVGEAAKNEAYRDSARVVSLIKRHMGEDGFTRDIDDVSYSPPRISAMVLRQLVESAYEHLAFDLPADNPIADVVITVPAYFGAGERQATRDAGVMAGLEVVGIINEPTAAALAYGAPDDGGRRTILVYDLGGGTFDVTVISLSPEEFRSMATDGDHRLGGADWDAVLVSMLAEAFESEHGLDPRSDEEGEASLHLTAEQAKKDLTAKERCRGSITAHGKQFRFEIGRADYEERTAHLLQQTMDFTRAVIAAAKTKGVERYDDLLLVGGMSRTPVITQRLAQEFPELPPARLSDPEQMVAKGAALFAHRAVVEIEEGDSDLSVRGRNGQDSVHNDDELRVTGPRIVNITSKGYGVHVYKNADDEIGRVSWFIKPNDQVPTTETKTLRTMFDNQDQMLIEIFESPGTSLTDVVADNRLLVDGLLKGMIPNRPAGQTATVDVELGDDGIVRIRAVSENGKELALEAKIGGQTPLDEMNTPLPEVES